MSGSSASGVSSSGAQYSSASASFFLAQDSEPVYVAKSTNIQVVLHDQFDRRFDAPGDLKIAVTVTTLETLDDAKGAVGSSHGAQKGASQKSLEGRRIILPAGKRAVRVEGIFPKGEEDIEVSITSMQEGIVRVFVEGENLRVGATVLGVLGGSLPSTRGKKALLEQFEETESGIRPAWLQLASWQEPRVVKVQHGNLPPGLGLCLLRAGTQLYRKDGTFIDEFYVVLQTMTGKLYAAPEDITVYLEVVKGAALFEPVSLKISRGRASSEEKTKLKSGRAGKFDLLARAFNTPGVNISPLERPYEIPLDTYATKLDVSLVNNHALANGLDEITLEVKAVQEADGQVIPSEKEFLEQRNIQFRVSEGAGIRFENGVSRITIPQNETTGRIKIFASRPVLGTIVAESINGFSQTILSHPINVSFYFPWAQLLLAILGGLTVPLLRSLTAPLPPRQRLQILMQGMAGGGVLFGLALFGAITMSGLNWGGFPVALARLPTDSMMAAFIIGILSSIIVDKFFGIQPAVATRKVRAVNETP